jgi:adenosylcobinamide kinase/adenosylcobinamide-phosphate guanylyltransferase
MPPDFAKSTLVLGGARSGKSRFAQDQAEQAPGELVFIATAQAHDAELRERISQHRRARGPRWRTVEAPLALAAAIGRQSAPGNVVLVDCLTLWASNLMLAERDITDAIAAITMAISAAPGRIILVSNEVGLGIVPANALARRFRDVAGSINQAVAKTVDTAVFVAAGLPIVLKPQR